MPKLPTDKEPTGNSYLLWAVVLTLATGFIVATAKHLTPPTTSINLTTETKS
jgi:hypothetical protein